MLTESRYSFTLSPALSQRHYRYLLTVAAVVIILVVSTSLWWAAISAFISLGMAYVWPLGKAADLPTVWVISEAGDGHSISCADTESEFAWQICAGSKLLPFALYLRRYYPQLHCYEACWVFPWQTRDIDYRRLARIIFRQGQH